MRYHNTKHWTLRTESPSIAGKSFAGKQNKKNKEDLLQENSDNKSTIKHVSHSIGNQQFACYSCIKCTIIQTRVKIYV